MTTINNSQGLAGAGSAEKHEVTFYTYPKFVFCWPIIVLGFAFWLLREHAWLDSERMAWIWGFTVLVVLLTLGFDVSRNVAIFWVVLIAGSWFTILWLRDVKSVTVFSRIYQFFADLNPQYSPSLGVMLSLLMTVFYIIMWIWSRINSKWRITHNEFEHYQFGRMDDSLGRGAKSVRTSYPDFFELLLCMAGDLVIYDSTGRRELRRINHVPMLPLVRKRINRILEMTAITTEEGEAADGALDADNGDRSV
jgi:hypothetical protein